MVQLFWYVKFKNQNLYWLHKNAVGFITLYVLLGFIIFRLTSDTYSNDVVMR